jgi:hypothetical protein
MTPQRCGNQIQLIGQDFSRHHTDSCTLQQLADCRSREVDLLPPRAAVADRQHNGANIGKEILGHASQSTGFPHVFRNFAAIASKPEEGSKMRK